LIPQQISGSLYWKVFAVHSGGQILGPDNDLVGQIEKCVQDAATFYRISFDTNPPRHLDEYHDLKIQISRPGLTAHTNTGYYNEPSWK
jgi:hypothetical protein